MFTDPWNKLQHRTHGASCRRLRQKTTRMAPRTRASTTTRASKVSSRAPRTPSARSFDGLLVGRDGLHDAPQFLQFLAVAQSLTHRGQLIPDGYGVLTLKSGDVYQGQFVSSDMTGFGVMISADGSKYTGEFKGGKFEGLGMFESKDGTKFTGQFEGSAPVFGLMTFKDGSHGAPKLVNPLCTKLCCTTL